MTKPFDGTTDPGMEPATPDERAGDPLAARRKAMDLLARREYCRHELLVRLEREGFLADTAAFAVSGLAQEGLVDDERYAESLLRARAGRGQGPLRIRRELKERGVDESVATRAVATWGDDWVELAQSVRRKKFGSGMPRNFADRAKQMRFLEYRGFSHDQIRAAVASDD